MTTAKACIAILILCTVVPCAGASVAYAQFLNRTRIICGRLLQRGPLAATGIILTALAVAPELSPYLYRKIVLPDSKVHDSELLAIEQLAAAPKTRVLFGCVGLCSFFLSLKKGYWPTQVQKIAGWVLTLWFLGRGEYHFKNNNKRDGILCCTTGSLLFIQHITMPLLIPILRQFGIMA